MKWGDNSHPNLLDPSCGVCNKMDSAYKIAGINGTSHSVSTIKCYKCTQLPIKPRWHIFASKTKVCALTVRSAPASGQFLWAFRGKPSSPLSASWLRTSSAPPATRALRKQASLWQRTLSGKYQFASWDYLRTLSFVSSSSKHARESFTSCESISAFTAAQLMLPCIIASSNRINCSELLLSRFTIRYTAILNLS